MIDDIPKKWVGGICIKEDSVLLIYRINREKDFNQEYFVFPGGDVGADESIESALTREFSEASIKVKPGDLFYSSEDDGNDDAVYYYLCEYVFGEPSFIEKSVEVAAMQEGMQLYTPMWIPIRELDDLIVYPESVKSKLLEELQYN